MSNFDYRYNTNGSSALKPRHLANDNLVVLEGGACRGSDRPRAVRGQARRAYDWYVSADAPACSTPTIGDRERLGCCLVFLTVAAMVLLGALV